MYIPVHTSMYQYIPVHTATSTYFSNIGHTGMYWYVQVHGAPGSGTRPKFPWVTRMVVFGPGKFYLENDDVSRRNDCFKRKETP